MTNTRLRQGFLILLLAGITAAFVAMIRDFLLTILLAAIFSALTYQPFCWLADKLKGRRALAAVATLLLLLVLVLGPILTILAVAANEAVRVAENVRPQVELLISQPGEIERRMRMLPGYEHIAPYRAEALNKIGELLSGASAFVFTALSATTRATALFIFHFVVLLYTMFFFLTGGPQLLSNAISFLPLSEADKARMLGTFVSVTRATLKGTILIGIAQGILGGLAFWVVGFEGPIFWGVVMTVLSIIPGIGGTIVWLPAAIYLVATGMLWRGIGLAIFCSLVIGTVDNLLRPILVGKDIKMHELMIFFSTLGGLMMFGAMGFIVGPILAALFVTVWEMFAVAFQGALVEPGLEQGREGP